MSYPQQGGYYAPPPAYPPPGGGGYGPPPPRRNNTALIVGVVAVVVVAIVAVVLVVVLTGGDDDKDTAGGNGSLPAPGAVVPGGSGSGGSDSGGSGSGGSDSGGSDSGSDGGDSKSGDGGPSPEAMADEVVRVVEQHDTDTIRRYACTEQEADDLYSELARLDGVEVSATVNDVEKSGDTAQASITMSAGGQSEDFTVEMAHNDDGLWCVTGI